MFIAQRDPYECAPTAIFNAVRAFFPDTPMYVFDDIKCNLYTGERMTDYGQNMFCLGTFWHREWLVIKELELLGYWKIVKDDVSKKDKAGDPPSFCARMRRRMLQLLEGGRIAIVRGSVDQSKLGFVPPAMPYEMKEMKDIQDQRECRQFVQQTQVHTWLIPCIVNQQAQCVNLFSKELAMMVPVDALQVNGYWVLERNPQPQPGAKP